MSGLVDKTMTERALQDAVIETMEWAHWNVFHDEDSRRNRAGFPDVCAVRGNRIMFIEFKSWNGRLRPGQVAWLDELVKAVGEVYLVRPDDLNLILGAVTGDAEAALTCHWNNRREGEMRKVKT